MMPMKYQSKINTFSVELQRVHSNVTFIDHPGTLKDHIKEFTTYVEAAKVHVVGLDIGTLVGFQGAGDMLILYAGSRGLIFHLHKQGLNLPEILILLDGSKICFVKNSHIDARFDCHISGFGVDVRVLVGRVWRNYHPKTLSLGCIANALKIPYQGVGSSKIIRLPSAGDPYVILNEANVKDAIENAFLCYQIAHKILSSVA